MMHPLKTLVYRFLFSFGFAASINAQEVKLGLPVGHTDFVTKLFFSPNDKYLVSVSGFDLTLNIWDIRAQKVVYSIITKSQVRSVEIDHAMNYLLVHLNSNELQLWDFKTGKLIHEFDELGAITAAAFKKNSNSIFFVSASGTIGELEIMSMKVNNKLIVPISGNLISVFSEDRKFLCVHDRVNLFQPTARSHTLVVDLLKMKTVFDTQFNGITYASTFSRNNKFFSISIGDSTHVYAFGEKGVVSSFKVGDASNFSGVSPHSFLGDEQFITINGESILIFEIRTGNKLHQLDVSGLIVSIQLSNDDNYLMSTNWEKVGEHSYDTYKSREKIIDLKTYNVIRDTVYDSNALCFTLSYNSTMTVTSENNVIRLNEFLTNKLITRIGLKTSIYKGSVLLNSEKQFVIGTESGSLTGWDFATGLLTFDRTGFSKDLMYNSLQIGTEGDVFITSSDDSTATIWDSLGNPIRTFRLNGYCGFSFYDNDLKKAITLSGDNGGIQVWDLQTSELIFKDSCVVPHSESCYLDKTGRYLFCKKRFLGECNDLSVVDLNSKSILYNKSNYSNSQGAMISGDASKMFIEKRLDRKTHIVEVWDISTDKIIDTIKGSILDKEQGLINTSDKYLLTLQVDTLFIWDQTTLSLLNKTIWNHTPPIGFASFTQDNLFIIASLNSIFIYDLSDFKLLYNFTLNFKPRDAVLTKNNRYMVLFGQKNVTIYDLKTNKEVISHYYFENDPKKWVHLHPSGYFDASQEAMDLMYWTKALEIIEFTQLKDRYWIPGLWQKVMEGKPLPEVRGMNELKLQPSVEFGELKDGKIPVTLTKRDGGYGKVTVLINGKEVEADARGENFDSGKDKQVVWIDLKDHPNLQNGDNTIAVKVSSEDGFVTGRPVEKKVSMTLNRPSPHFYAVIVGTGQYVNNAINLKYPEKDAQSMSTALQVGAEQLFGKERVHLYTLTTAAGDRPTKEKIKSTFDEISKQASSSDVILVYLSGHGMAYGGDQSDFYYITTDATSSRADAYSDEVLLKNTTISTIEFTEYLKDIPALKQIMIIDACNSGKAVDNLHAKNMDASQLKAIDRMKDRTGMFVISGSAANAVSYEASRYGQGILTYAILQAMKGASLRDGEYFDVNMIMNYARENVPKLASGIGGIQTPQLLSPKGGSFDIGRVDEKLKEQIPLNAIKPMFVRTVFLDMKLLTDTLGFSRMVDNQLNEISMSMADAELVFMDVREFPDAYELSGGYSQERGQITLQLKVRGPKNSDHLITGATKEEVLKKILAVLGTLE
jgi:WD40 repeat protein